jgi:membrane protein implicated in regulation of membrane protease activity
MAAPEQADGTPAGTPGGTPSDLSVTALILAIAGALWFGWGQAEPPAGWGLPMVIGMFAAIAVAIVAAVAVRRFRHGATAMADQRVRRGYGITVGVEVAAIAIGSVALGLTGHPDYTAPWILLVVGVHFVPLGRLFGIADLVWSGLVLSAVAIAAAVTGALSAVAPSAITGAFGGLVLLAAAATSLRKAVLGGRLEGRTAGGLTGG